MGYITHYKLSVKDSRELSKKRDPEYFKFVEFMEEAETNRNCGKKRAADAFQFGPDEYMEIPVSWLYDFWLEPPGPKRTATNSGRKLATSLMSVELP